MDATAQHTTQEATPAQDINLIIKCINSSLSVAQPTHWMCTPWNFVNTIAVSVWLL